MKITDEAVEAAKRIRDTAMQQTLAARIPESGHFGAIAQDADWLADHLTAALPHMGGVEIKPLEWEDADEGMCTKWRAAALGGHYELVSFDKEPGFAVNFHWGRPLSFWFIQGEPDEWGPTGPKIFPTLEEAKAAAMQDFEKRILSSLSPAPVGDVHTVHPLACHEPAPTDTQEGLSVTGDPQVTISDARLAEIVGAGKPCVPIEPWEVAHIVQELRRARAALGGQSNEA